MLALELIELSLIVNTFENKTFKTKIPFSKGLNVIRADNTSGKSTCVNAIAYALGLESILGPLKKKPFPRSLYEVIDLSKNDNITYNVSASKVTLTLKNNESKVAKLTRLIKNPNNIITVELDGVIQDYFLKSYGTLGSSKSELGFHNWLEKYMNWQLPSVPSQTGSAIKLYLEAVFPLFFIEQKRGWSEIQANVPVNFGIRNVKKTALEYVLNISNFENENKINHYKGMLSNYEEQWNFNVKSIESLCDSFDFYSSDINSISDQVFPLNYYMIGVNAKILLKEAKTTLENQLSSISSDNLNVDFDSEISTQRDTLRSLIDDINKLENKKDQLNIVLHETNRKTQILNSDLEKYRQLNLLTKLGSEHNNGVSLDECPICHSQLTDFLHISHKKSKTLPMTLEQNISFLKDQHLFMNNIISKHKSQILDIESAIQIKNNTLKQEEEKFNKLESDYIELFGDIHHNIRRKIEIENKIGRINQFNEKVENYEKNLNKIQKQWTSINSAYLILKEKMDSHNTTSTIKKLENIMKNNLSLFGFSESSVNEISISDTTLRPAQNGYDIIAETSASDYIRTIWAYTLALLELGADSELNIQHSGFIIFDEPRQHEARSTSLFNLIEHTSQIFANQGQAIFTTSYENLDSFDQEINNANIIYFDDYILQPE
ncbi:hypothetical protein ABFP25_01985 [Acinetobacter indicus]|uniref:hypothetical protein n=1 Tax=Acinetobacter indicus TaxID=756892 RepID=UPI00321571D0